MGLQNLVSSICKHKRYDLGGGFFLGDLSLGGGGGALFLISLLQRHSDLICYCFIFLSLIY